MLPCGMFSRATGAAPGEGAGCGVPLRLHQPHVPYRAANYAQVLPGQPGEHPGHGQLTSAHPGICPLPSHHWPLIQVYAPFLHAIGFSYTPEGPRLRTTQVEDLVKILPEWNKVTEKIDAVRER
eukprot:1184771-Prorocentrum_minimum.AAC.1